MSQRNQEADPFGGLSRRNMFAVGSTLATAALAQVAAQAQKRPGPANNPGPENTILHRENPNSNRPPATDHGDVGAIWYSFDLTKLRVEKGGWTHEVTQRQLPSSKDIAGVTMRLTSGSFRELHWHTADEWAMMLYGRARITVLNPDGTIFIEDVSKSDLWYFPAGYPHSIQGLGPDGCEFLLVFDEGQFSEDNTFLLSEWLAHTPPEILSKNFGLDKSVLAAP